MTGGMTAERWVVGRLTVWLCFVCFVCFLCLGSKKLGLGGRRVLVPPAAAKCYHPAQFPMPSLFAARIALTDFA